MGMMSSRLLMRFEPEQEADFQQASALPRLRHFLVSGAISIVNFNAFLLVDAMLVPDVLEQALLLRLFLFTPLGLFFIYLCWRYRQLVLDLPRWMLEVGVASFGVVASLTIAMLLHQTHSPYAYAYHAGFVAVLLYGNLVQRLRFVWALGFTVTVLLIHFHAAWKGPAMPTAVHWPMLAFVSAMAGYTLLTNFRLEHEERQRYLQLSRAQTLRGQLRDSRAQLEVVSRLDALTGVANRRGFDIHLQHIASQQWRHGRMFSLILVDVDHFKAFNDRYGHPAGDECLRLVAKALDQQLPKGDALVARWGGEEFVLVLPGMGAAQACELATTLQQGVQALGIRHECSPTAPSVTISLGVAVWAGASRENLDQLVARADEALYRAKHLGRNRWVQAPEAPYAAPATGMVGLSPPPERVPPSAAPWS
jgi:diguanylate cyclase (GGDEF)-like protein